MHSSYLDRLDLLPPKICRVLARNGRRGIPATQLSKRSGLSLRRIAFISTKESWADVPLREIDAFRLGCGITPENEWRVWDYIFRYQRHGEFPRLTHLKSLHSNERRRLRALFPPEPTDPFIKLVVATLS